MTTPLMPRYPVYIPSKGRADQCLAARMLERDGVPYHLVIEPTEYDAYAQRFSPDRLLVLPFHDLNQGAVPARNWIMDHAIASGAARHWQLDDNIAELKRRWKGKRLYCAAGAALHITESFTDRYTNVALTGLNYEMFLTNGSSPPPFYLNQRVYSCTLVNNAIPHRWRGRYNDDTDLCLQVLAAGWCTLLLNCFFAWKPATMRMAGGMTPTYQGDGRLAMARSLERLWPGVVTVNRRWNRPQHMVAFDWRRFDTPLIPKADFTLPDGPDEFGLRLTERAPLQSETLRALVADRLEADR